MDYRFARRAALMVALGVAAASAREMEKHQFPNKCAVPALAMMYVNIIIQLVTAIKLIAEPRAKIVVIAHGFALLAALEATQHAIRLSQLVTQVLAIALLVVLLMTLMSILVIALSAAATA
jgi:hypothetical protein